MRVEKPKIELYQVRNFGQKFAATFDFLSENFRLLLRACIYLILPLCLVQALATESIMGSLMGYFIDDQLGAPMTEPSTDVFIKLGVYYTAIILCTCIGAILLVSICYAMLKYYRASSDRLRGVTLRDLKPLIIQCMKRSLKLGLLLSAVWLVIGIFAFTFAALAESMVLFALFAIVFVIFIIPLSLAMPVYIFEDDETAFGAVRRAIALGFHAFWPLVLLMLVIGLLANVLQTITTLPWYIAFLVKAVVTASEEGNAGFIGSPVYGFLEYILAVVMSFGMYLTMSLSTVALAYQYGSVAEEMDGLSVEDDIEHFEQLAEEDKEIDNFDQL